MPHHTISLLVITNFCMISVSLSELNAFFKAYIISQYSYTEMFTMVSQSYIQKCRMRVIIPAGIHIILIKSPISKCNLEGLLLSLSLHHGSFLNIHFNHLQVHHISSGAEKLDAVFLYVACAYHCTCVVAGVNNCTWSTDMYCFYGSHTK